MALLMPMVVLVSLLGSWVRRVPLVRLQLAFAEAFMLCIMGGWLCIILAFFIGYQPQLAMRKLSTAMAHSTATIGTNYNKQQWNAFETRANAITVSNYRLSTYYTSKITSCRRSKWKWKGYHLRWKCIKPSNKWQWRSFYNCWGRWFSYYKRKNQNVQGMMWNYREGWYSPHKAFCATSSPSPNVNCPHYRTWSLYSFIALRHSLRSSQT